jgi:hypothetical protein
MAAWGARVIDLEEFRRRRAQRDEERETSRKATLPALCVWYPVWYWVPVVPGI